MRYLVVGAGLAGCSAALLLKRAGHTVVVVEARREPGGLCSDGPEGQKHGPHVFHTDDREVWEWLNAVMPFSHVDLEVRALVPPGLVELPRRGDPVFEQYTVKAWGRPWSDLPEGVRSRVPQVCTDGRVGYHRGNYKGIPQQGWTALCLAMLREADCMVCYGTNSALRHWTNSGYRVVFTGALDDIFDTGPRLEWLGRSWTHCPGELPAMQINYCTPEVPQIRSWDNRRLSPIYQQVVGTEWFCRHGKCYPVLTLENVGAAGVLLGLAAAAGLILCGRAATYQYLDMDQTVRQTMDSLKAEGAI